MDSIKSLDEILEHFESKIDMITKIIPIAKLCNNANNANNNGSHHKYGDIGSNLEQLTALIPINYDNTNPLFANNSAYVPDLSALSMMTIEMKAMIDEMYGALSAQSEALLSDHHKCINDLNLLENHCQYIKNNIPIFLSQSNINKSNKPENIVSDVQKKNAQNREQTVIPEKSVANTNTNAMPKPVITAKPKNASKKESVNKTIANISFVTTSEFSLIPNYMRGRLTYEEINRAIGNFNRAIACKYKLIYGYSTKYNDEELKKYHTYKEQENSETNGEFFCTINDLRELSDMKNEIITTTRKILTCLRHCKRIKEIRGPNKLIRYAIVKDSTNFNNI